MSGIEAAPVSTPTSRQQLLIAMGRSGSVGLLGCLMVAGLACGTDLDGLGGSGVSIERASGPAGSAPAAMTSPTAPTATSTPTPVDPQSSTVVIRGETVAANRVIARVVYADTIVASRALVPDVRRDNAQQWQAQIQTGDLAFDDLRADVIYARQVKVGDLQAAQVFVRDLSVQPPAPPSMPPANSPAGPGMGAVSNNNGNADGDEDEGDGDAENGKDGEEGGGKGKGKGNGQGSGNGNGNGNDNGQGKGNGNGKGGHK